MTDLPTLLAQVIEDTKGMTEGRRFHAAYYFEDGEVRLETRGSDERGEQRFSRTICKCVGEPAKQNAAAIAALLTLALSPRLPELLEAVRRIEAKTIFLLYGGHSVDGRGGGVYEGYTFDFNKAVDHAKNVASSPYNIGYVLVCVGRETTYIRDPFKLLEMEEK